MFEHSIFTTVKPVKETSHSTRHQFLRMKVLFLSLAVLCTIASNVQAQFIPSTGPTFPRPPGPFPGPQVPTFPRPWGPPFPGGPYVPTFPRPQTPVFRFRRESPEEPQGSISVQGRQPLSGPDRHPSLDINYNHHVINNDRTKLDAFGGANLRDGRFTPQAGVGLEHRFKNDIFVHGQGQVQPGPRGGLSPSFGAGVGWRFRREALPYEEEEVMENVY